MSIKSSTWSSKIAVQALMPEISQPPAGPLPTFPVVEPPVPEVVLQGDSYFSRNSIGTSFFESRNDPQELSGRTIPIQECPNEEAKKAGLSLERPVIIASSDILQNLSSENVKAFNRISSFENNLLQSDLDYIVQELKGSAIAGTITSLENETETSRSKLSAYNKSINLLANSAEKFSEDLDFRLSWDSLKDLIVANYENLSSLYQTGEVTTNIRELLPNYESSYSSNDIIQDLSSLLQVTDPVVKILEERLEQYDALFDNGAIQTYNGLARINKTFACCNTIASIFSRTFSNETITNIPVSYNSGNVFISATSADGKFGNYDAIVNPAIQLQNTSSLAEFQRIFVNDFTNSIISVSDSSGVKNNGGLGSPIDIFLRLLKFLAGSFTSIADANSRVAITNSAEITESLVAVMSLARQGSSPVFTGFVRGTLLTLLTNQNLSNFGLVPNEDIGLNVPLLQESFWTENISKNFENSSLTYAKQLSTDGLIKQFDPEYSITSTQSSVGDFNINAPRNEENFQTDRSFSFYNSLPGGSAFGNTGQESIASIVIDALNNFGRKVGTLGSKIVPFYRDIVSLFESIYGKTLPPSGFVSINRNTLSSRAIYDLIIEAMSNMISIFIKPGYSPLSVERERINERGAETQAEIDEINSQIEALQDEIKEKNNEINELERLIRGLALAAFITIGAATLSVAAVREKITDLKNEISDNRREIRRLRRRLDDLRSERDEIRNARENTVDYRINISKDYVNFLNFSKTMSSATGDLLSTLKISIARQNILAQGPFGNNQDEQASWITPGDYSKLTNFIESTNLKKSRIASLFAMSDKLTLSTANFSRSINESFSAMSQLPQLTKNQISSNLTVEIASNSSLKVDNVVNEGNYGTVKDIALSNGVAAAFINFNAGLLRSNARVTSIGIPSGFIRNLKSTTTDASIGKRLKYLELEFTARSLTQPGKRINSFSRKFHPQIVYQYVTAGSGRYRCYDKESGEWITLSRIDASSFIRKGGKFSGNDLFISPNEINEILDNHAIDAAASNILKAFSQIESDASKFDNKDFTIPLSKAKKLQEIFSGARQDLIPRRGLTLSQVIKPLSGGNLFEPVKYTDLPGELSNLTTPADHALLLAFINSAIFSQSFENSKYLIPSAFERIFNVIIRPNEFQYTDGSASGDIYSLCVIATNVKAVY